MCNKQMEGDITAGQNIGGPFTLCKSPRTLLTAVLLTSLLVAILEYEQLPLRSIKLHNPGRDFYRHIVQHVQEFKPNIRFASSQRTGWIYSNKTRPTVYPLKPDVKVAKGLSVVGDGEFYIFTVVAQQNKNLKISSNFYITGWEVPSATDTKYLCCFKFSNGTTQTTTVSHKLSWGGPKQALRARQAVCDNSNGTPQEAPIWASLVTKNESCENKKEFHEIAYIRPVMRPSFALCGKIAYGKKDPGYLIEWMEYHKYMGVSKIMIYTYADLHEPARKTLDYYVKEGILETIPMPFAPKLAQFPRHFSVQNSSVMWQDEKMPLFDVQQRLRPYSYLGVIDTDEFIVPKQPEVTNLVQLMEYLLKKYQNGGTFRMLSEIHIMSWNKTDPGSDLMIQQYGNVTEPTPEAAKFLIVNDRLKEGSIWIHQANPIPGYKVIFPKADSDVVLKHFRKCKQRWLRKGKDGVPNKCHGGFQRHRDALMDKMADAIGPNIRRVRSLLKL